MKWIMPTILAVFLCAGISGAQLIGPGGGGGGGGGSCSGDINVGCSQVTGLSHVTNNSLASSGLATTAVTAGSYTATNLTVNAEGQITAASNGSAGGAPSFNPASCNITSNAMTPTCTANVTDTICSVSIAANLTVNLSTTSCSPAQSLLLFIKQTAGSLSVTYSNTGVTETWNANCDGTGTCNQPALSGSGDTDLFKFTYDTLPATPTFHESGQALNVTLVPVSGGGTGATTLTNHGLLKGQGTSAIAAMAVCGNGSIPYGQAGADPICSTLTFPNSATTGDIFYANASNAMGNLADVATGSVLASAGTSTAPTYSANPNVTSISTGSNPNCTAGTGGVLCATEGTAATGVASVDELWADSTAHAWKAKLNNGSAINMVTGANDNLVVSAPTAPNSTSSFTMQGLAGSITPQKSGNILIVITGTVTQVSATTADIGDIVQISYGTGTAPTTNAALTGTQVGPQQTVTIATTATAVGDVHNAFAVNAVVTGLTIGTAYWIDLAAKAVTTASDAPLTQVGITAIEQ